MIYDQLLESGDAYKTTPALENHNWHWLVFLLEATILP